MANNQESKQQSLFMNPSKGEIVRIIILSLMIGLTIPALSFVLEQFLLSPAFCHSGDTPDFCSDITSTAYYISSGLMAVISIVILANWQIFRPLIIAVASVASLWGLNKYIGGIVEHNTIEYYAFSVGLYLSSYLMFYWAMRIRNFTISLAAAILLIVIIRFALVS